MALAWRMTTFGLAIVLLAPFRFARPLSAQEAARTVPAIVGGRIMDHESGQPLAGAAVSLRVESDEAAAPMVRTSDEEGHFEFRAVPPGSYALSVELLGYRTFADGLEVVGGTDVRLVIRLSPAPLMLEPVVVVTARRLEFMPGFEERRARDRSHTAFFTAAEIEAQNPRVISDLFAMVPGAYVQPGLMTGNPLGNVLTVAGVPGASPMRGGCAPDIWLNGFLAEGLPFDEMFMPDQVEAVELYTVRHEIPNRFRGPRGCGALVIWLREREEDDFLPTWQRWLVALAAVGATILLAR